jgi:HK97 family phage major capsid protein
MTKYQRLLAEAAAAAKSARAIAEKAEADNGRDMTADERAEFDAKFAEATDKKSAADVAKADEAVLAQAKSLADLIGPAAVDDLAEQKSAEPHRDAPARKSLGEQFVGSPQFKALLAAFTDSTGVININEKMRVQSDPVSFKSLIRSKALFVGSSPTSVGGFVVPERTDIVEMLGRRPLTIRDLISVRRTGSDTVEYVKQLAHTNAAAPVAEATSSASPTTGASAGAALTLDPNGGYVPEGAWTFQKQTAVVKTISEWVPATKRSLADVAALEGLINDELVKDLQEAEETQILTGNGTGENLQGILTTSGIQTTAAVTTNDATWFASYRTALRLARTVGRVNPTAIVVNPTQGEKIDTAKDAQNRFYGPGPFFAGANRSLWGVPVIESEAITAGTALIGDFSKAVLWDREQSSVTATDSHADFFIRRLVAILAEERVAFAVTRPAAFVTLTGL